ncbi:PilW family protein [Halopseudomonas salegens]|uniref:Type IV pilus assembly protein PilW n=1 Tax=Halopseudomonas salegens TaxID=1434072 RepID=A0A1H2EBG8_9GAMM|nr:PilW family protein [Halopseudomonas salegens]SDT92457.1 type IV pilus assembly protein PilW [Halopseudomonas salegens]
MKRSQMGLTLIELMIALLLGLLLSLAAVQLLLSNQRTFSLQEAVTSVNEDGQMVLRYIAADIRNAGRGSQIEGYIQPVVLSLSAEDSEGETVTFESTDGGSGGNDTLVVSYLGSSACQGADLTAGGTKPEGEVVVNRYYVSDGSLWCSSLKQTGLGAGSYELLTPGSVELISGVESFQVLYGVDGDVNNEIGTTKFVTATNLVAADSVVAIRIGLLLRSNDSSLTVPTDSQTLTVLDEDITTPSDRSIRRVFTTTAQVRNVYWEGI